jgi:hypothetical protein
MAAISGLIVVVAYLGGAFLSGRLDPFARRPVLDGFAPPPPYRWVNPPSDQAAGNQAPSSGRFEVKFDADGVSAADVLSTDDLQVTLILSDGSFASASGQRSAVVTVQPLDPAKLGPPPAGLRVSGNAYKIAAAYRPGGAAIKKLALDVQLTLVYPPSPDGLIHRHAIIRSPDGTTWTALPSNDAGSQAGVEVGSFGYYAVGEYVTGGKKKPFPIGKVIQYAGIGALLLVIGVPIVVHEVRTRRARRSRRRAGGPRSRTTRRR